MNRNVILLPIALAFLACAAPATADEARIRIVFFTPRDVQPPENVTERMKQVVDYGQAFYGKWLRHWGYEPENPLPVDRDENGNPIVYFVKGVDTSASGEYDRVGIQGPIRDQAIKQYRIPRSGSTWWIFVYGTKLKVSRGWGGHADRGGNGYTLLVWNDVAGEISINDPLAGGVADQLNLKGYLHEFAHTMSLPHIGPNDRHNLGMSLMGPNARTYRKTRANREQRVYITPAVAALIWKQPQMTGRYDPRPKMPRIEVRSLEREFDPGRKRFSISGQLKSDMPAHSIVAIDIPQKGPSSYWRKSYASRLEDDGSFILLIDELAPSSGVLKIVFCFENGAFTGNGKGIGFRHAVEIPYRYARNRFRFEP